VYICCINKNKKTKAMENKRIYSALIAVMREVSEIKKGQKNQQQGFMFRGIDEVMNELHSLFAKNGIIILPEILQKNTTTAQTKSGGIMYHVELNCKFSFIAEDGSQVEAVGAGEAMDSGDKGTSKALSIALKYVLLQMFLIPTQEKKDPDYDTPPESVQKNKKILISGTNDPRVPEIIKALASGYTLADVKKKYELTAAVEQFINKSYENIQK